MNAPSVTKCRLRLIDGFFALPEEHELAGGEILISGQTRRVEADTHLRDLKRPHIEAMFTAFDKGDADRKPLAPSTQYLTHTVLKMAFEYFVDADMLVRYPIRGMKPPKQSGPRDRILTIEECKAILEASRGTRWHAFFVLLATTGMRMSECLGLEWRNVDLDAGTARVEFQTGRVYGQPGVHLVDLKSEASQ